MAASKPQLGSLASRQPAGGAADRGRARLAHGRLGPAPRRRARLGRPGPRLPALRARTASGGLTPIRLRKRHWRLLAELDLCRSRCRTRRGRPPRARCRCCWPGWRGGLRSCRRCSRARLRSRALSELRLHQAGDTIRGPAALSATGPAPHVGALPGRANTCATVWTP